MAEADKGGDGAAADAVAAAPNAADKVDECHFFYEDEVYRVNARGHLQFGMVVENSELVSSDEEEGGGDHHHHHHHHQGQARAKTGGRRGSRGDPEDEDDDDGRYDMLRKGYVRVAWHPKGNEQILHEKMLNLADRSLMPGDVVRRFIRGKDTQRGYCRRVRVFCSARLMGTDRVVHGVGSADLRPVEDFATDVVVCMGSWLGMVKMVRSVVTVRFIGDGSVVALDDREAEQLEDVLEAKDEQSEFRRYDFYPGQVLSGPLRVFAAGDFKNKTQEMEKALKSEKKGKIYRVVVLECKAHSLGVNWQCKTNNNVGGDDAKSYTPPDYVVTDEQDLSNKVRTLNVFEPCTIQIGDRNFYTLKEEDLILSKEDWKRLERETLGLPPRAKARRRRDPKERPPGKRKKTGTDKDDSSGSYEDVEDTDDEASNNGDSSDDDDEEEKSAASKRPQHKRPSMPVGRAGGRKKLKKARRGGASSNGSSSGAGKLQSEVRVEVKPGDRVAVEVLRTRSEAEVIWQDGTVEEGIPSTELFPIHHLDDQEFFCGDFVVKTELLGTDPHLYGVVQTVDHLGRTCKVRWFRTYTTGSVEAKPQELEESEEPVYDLRDHPVFKYRPGSIVIRVANFSGPEDGAHGSDCTGGQVLDNYPCGQVLVRWADGRESFSWPQDLFKVGEYDSDDEGGLWDDEDEEADWSDVDDGGDDGADSWETESEHSVEEEEDKEATPTNDEEFRPRLADAIEKSRAAISKLEEGLQQQQGPVGGDGSAATAALRQILEAYRGCRQLDRLMGTAFFHEDNFEGLLEKVKYRSRISSTQKMVHDQVNLLFADGSKSSSTTPPARPMTLLTPAVTPPPPEELSEQTDEQADGSRAEGGASTGLPVKPSSLTKKPPPLAQAQATMSNFLVPTAHPGSLSAMAAGSNKSSFDSSCWSKTSSMDVHTLSTAASPNAPSPGPPVGPLGLMAPPSPVSHARAAAAALSVVAEAQDSGCEDEEEEEEKEEKEQEPEKKDASKADDEKSQTANPENNEDPKTENEVFAPPDASSSTSTTTHPQDMTDAQVCSRLCALLNAQLHKFHQEMLSRYGGQESVFSPEDLEETAEERGAQDLEGIMRIVSSARNRLQEHMTAFASILSYVGNQRRQQSQESGGSQQSGGTPPARGVSSQDIAQALYGSSTNRDSEEKVAKSEKVEAEKEKESESTKDVKETSQESGSEVVKASSEGATASAPSAAAAESPSSSSFTVCESAPSLHKFHLALFQPTDPKNFIKFVRKEINLLKNSLPPGILVKAYEDRMDLYSVLIKGPSRTPYEDGVFLFDFQLSSDYPQSPPTCHYHSYCSDRLNPNLYEDGKVCVSLLGTWSGKGTETWSPNSNLLQLLVSIQGLILVGEPYYNEAGYERHRGTQQGRENSRLYNEMVLLKLLQSMARMVSGPPEIFKEEIREHFKQNGAKMIKRLETWRSISNEYITKHPTSPMSPEAFTKNFEKSTEVDLPEFPLVPASKGFCISLVSAIKNFRDSLTKAGIEFEKEKEAS